MMLNRSSDVELEFDFAKVIEKKQKKTQYFMSNMLMQELIQYLDH